MVVDSRPTLVGRYGQEKQGNVLRLTSDTRVWRTLDFKLDNGKSDFSVLNIQDVAGVSVNPDTNSRLTKGRLSVHFSSVTYLLLLSKSMNYSMKYQRRMRTLRLTPGTVAPTTGGMSSTEWWKGRRWSGGQTSSNIRGYN